MYRRHWDTCHGRDGFALVGWDMWLPFLVAEKAVETFLAAIGHPCCGRGLGRIPGVDMLFWEVLNLPSGWWRHNRRVIELLLTAEQAFTIQPSWRDETWITIDGEDEDGYLWRDGAMVRGDDGSYVRPSDGAGPGIR